MKPLLILVKNNLRVLFRSRSAVIAVILVPLLLLFFAGLAFDTTSIYRVRIGVWADSYNDLSTSVVDALESSEFQVTRHTKEQDCIDAVRLGDAHACVAFPSEFALGSGNNVLTFHVDPSRATLVTLVLDTVEPKITARSADFGRNITTSIVDALGVVRRLVEIRKDTIISLTTQVNAVGGTVTQVADALAAPSTDIDLNQQGLQDAQAKGAAFKSAALTLADAASSAADDIQDQLTDISSDVNATNLSSSSKSSINADIGGAIAEAKGLASTANASRTTLDSTNLTAVLDSLIAKLSSARTGVDQLNAARTGTIGSLRDARTKLDSALLAVADLQKTFNEMNAAIAGITITDPEAVLSPIKISVSPVTSEASYLNYVFPFLIVLVLLYSGLLLPPILILSERNSPAAYRTFLLPVRDVEFMGGILLSCLAMLGVQVLLMAGVSAVFFTNWFGLPVLIVALLALSALFILIGMLIGYAFQREFHAVLTSILVSTVLLLLSDFVVPLDVLPRAVSLIAALNPVVIGGDVVRLALLFGKVGFVAALADIGALLLYAAVLAVVVVLVHRNRRRFTLDSFLAAVMTGRKKK